MKFSDAYRDEMMSVRCGRSPDEFMQSICIKNERRKKLSFSRKVMVCIAVMVSVFCVGMVVSGESSYFRFNLQVKNEKYEFSESKPRDFDYEKFASSSDVLSSYGKEENCLWALFETDEYLKEYTGIQLPENNDTEFRNIMVSANPNVHIGHIEMDVYSADKTLRINGQFGIKTSENQDTDNNLLFGPLGYGTVGDEKIDEIIDFTDDRKAYVIKEEGSEVRVVYFSADNIQYQLISNKTHIDNDMLKKIIGYFYSNEKKIKSE